MNIKQDIKQEELLSLLAKGKLKHSPMTLKKRGVFKSVQPKKKPLFIFEKKIKGRFKLLKGGLKE